MPHYITADHTSYVATEDEEKYLTTDEQFHLSLHDWVRLVQERKGRKYRLSCTKDITGYKASLHAREGDVVGYYGTQEEANEAALLEMKRHRQFNGWGESYYAGKPPPYSSDDGPVEIVGPRMDKRYKQYSELEKRYKQYSVRNPNYVDIFVVDVDEEYAARKRREKEAAKESLVRERTRELLEPVPSDPFGGDDFNMWHTVRTLLQRAGYDIDESGYHNLKYCLDKLVQMDRQLFEETVEKNRYLIATWKVQLYYYHHHLKGQTLDKASLITTVGAYSKDQKALKLAQLYPKGSKERGQQINMMVQNGDVSSRTTFYERLKKLEEKELAEKCKKMQDPLYKRRVCPGPQIRSLGLGYNGDYVRENVRDNVRWKGSIILPLIPLTFSLQREGGEKVSSFVSTKRPTEIDICGFIGNSDLVSKVGSSHNRRKNRKLNAKCVMMQNPNDYPHSSNFARVCREKHLSPLRYSDREWERRISKLYFSSKEFSPPNNKQHPSADSDSVVRGRLRNYIEAAAAIGKSPVVCVGRCKPNEMRFRCKDWYRRQRLPSSKEPTKRPYSMYSCTFTFVVRWNDFGYFIPLQPSCPRLYNLGCAWHCCDERKA